MSIVLLTRVRDHIITTGGLLAGYTTRYFRWVDAELQGSGSIALFRMSGTFGDINRQAQFTDVSMLLMSSPRQAQQTDSDMLSVLQYLRANPTTTGAFNMFPLGTYTGPTQLQNGRVTFEMVIRTGTEDH